MYGNDGDNIRILQCLCQVGPMNAHTGTKTTLYARLSGSIEQYQMKGDSIVDHIITSDETRCHHYELESKWQCMEW